MTQDAEGFFYPYINQDECIKCRACLKICPWENYSKKHPLNVNAVKSLDSVTQYTSSSGGAFHEIAKYLLKSGYHIFGAAYTKDFSAVVHIKIDTINDLSLLKGSKYVQSNLNNTYSECKKLLLAGEKVLFSGTACQIAGLKSFLLKEYENLITVDLLCHGVPSPRLYKDYIHNVQSKYGDITAINMKDKSKGWKKSQIKIIASSEVPEHVCKLWNKIYYYNFAFRPSCYNCKFMDISRVGDISIGDYWGIDRVRPEFYDEAGVSLLMVNTQKGHAIYDAIKPLFAHTETSFDECIQPVLLGPQEYPEWRDVFWDDYYKYGFNEIAYKYWGVALENKVILKIKRLLKKLLVK